MPVELKVLGYAALLQIAQFIVMAVPVNLQLGTAYTGGNRDAQKQATGVPGRSPVSLAACDVTVPTTSPGQACLGSGMSPTMASA